MNAVFAALVFGSLGIFVLYALSRRRKHVPPGPRLRSLLQLTKDNWLDTFAQWKNEYGLSPSLVGLYHWLTRPGRPIDLHQLGWHWRSCLSYSKSCGRPAGSSFLDLQLETKAHRWAFQLSRIRLHLTSWQSRWRYCAEICSRDSCHTMNCMVAFDYSGPLL